MLIHAKKKESNAYCQKLNIMNNQENQTSTVPKTNSQYLPTPLYFLPDLRPPSLPQLQICLFPADPATNSMSPDRLLAMVVLVVPARQFSRAMAASASCPTVRHLILICGQHRRRPFSHRCWGIFCWSPREFAFAIGKLPVQLMHFF